ncbi:MAG: metallophosphoesterase [Bacteroidota bacterium]
MHSAGARTIVIGDIHGCLDELQDLLLACDVDWSADRVMAVGDLVAKGPDSAGVLHLARERHLEAVLGNHDAKVLSFGPRTGGTEAGSGHGKHHAAVARTLHADDWHYLEALPLYRELAHLGAIVAHGGLMAGVPLDQQPRNMVMNMRSVTAAGEPSKRVNDGVPWASVWPGPQHVVFGHDAVRGLQEHPFATGLDTGCVYGRSLTALVLPERRLISVPARRAYVEM